MDGYVLSRTLRFIPVAPESGTGVKQAPIMYPAFNRPMCRN